jgi:hypothetical protein
VEINSKKRDQRLRFAAAEREELMKNSASLGSQNGDGKVRSCVVDTRKDLRSARLRSSLDPVAESETVDEDLFG